MVAWIPCKLTCSSKDNEKQDRRITVYFAAQTLIAINVPLIGNYCWSARIELRGWSGDFEDFNLGHVNHMRQPRLTLSAMVDTYYLRELCGKAHLLICKKVQCRYET